MITGQKVLTEYIAPPLHSCAAKYDSPFLQTNTYLDLFTPAGVSFWSNRSGRSLNQFWVIFSKIFARFTPHLSTQSIRKLSMAH